MSDGGGETSIDLVEDVVKVCRTLVPHRVEWFHDEVTREVVEAILRGKDEMDLATPEGRRDLTGLVWAAKDVADGSPVDDRTRAFAAKVALVVADLRIGRTDRVQPWEAASVAMVLRRTETHPVGRDAEPTIVGMGADASIEFLFPWRPSPVRTGGRLGTEKARASLTTVDADDAPVACSLWTPEGDLEVRRLGTRWLRPVLSPGSWRPIDVTDFGAAASVGRAWRDNPFLPRTGRCGPTFDLDDVAAPRTPAKGDARRIVDARDACMARAGQLFVVAGTVHRMTEAPRAGVGTIFVGGNGLTGPMWVMGDLHSTSSMETLGHLDPPGASWCNAQVMPDRNGRFEGGMDLLPLSDWVGVAQSIGAGSGRRLFGDGPWPTAVDDLIDLRGPPDGSEVTACLRIADRCARGVSLVMPRDPQCRNPDDHRGILRHWLSVLLAQEGPGGLDETALTKFQAVCGRVLSRGPSPKAPWDGMWTYVAAIGFHVSSLELAIRRVDEDVVALRL